MWKRFASWLAALAVLLCIPSAFSQDGYPRASALDAIHYRLHLELNDQTDEIAGEAAILFEAESDGVSSLTLDLAGLRIDAVKENDQPARFTHSAERVRIGLQNLYKKDARFELKIRYHGRPQDGLFIKQNKFGDRAFFADNWPNRARYWFPAIDHPYDKATVEFFITAPERYDVIANGSLVETTNQQNGMKLSHWREATPIPTYCMVVGAAQFSILQVGASGCVPVSYYLYPKDRDNGVKDYGRAVKMLDYYTQLIGAYPYEKLALVQSSTRFGGMENSSAIFFDERAINGSGKLERTVAHEIAHQWFGDSVTEADWHHLWLSEGFASYFGDLFFEYADGREKFFALMQENKTRVIEAQRTNPRPIHDPQVKDLFALLNANNYQKGAWVLHMLRGVMGDEKFFAGIREYYRRFRDGNALTGDLQQVMEVQAGRSLDWFFKEWIFEAGYPVYDATWRWDAAAKEVRLHVQQRQNGAIFRMPLQVTIDAGGESRREVVEVSEREQTFTFKQATRPARFLLDPDEWVLKELTLREER